jgi:predicted ATPase
MDSLPLSEQLVLQQAAVIGRVFWEDALAAFNIGSDAPLALAELPAALSRLRQRDLIYLSPQSTFRQTNEYLFAHVILREVAYESVLIAERRHYHGLLADWLRGQTPLPSLELIGLAADHLSKAGRTAEAIADLMHAGQEAAARYANDEAIAYLTRALSLVPSGDRELRHKLLDLREKIISQLGDRARQAADLDQLEPLQ